jgi:hypothetical protein
VAVAKLTPLRESVDTAATNNTLAGHCARQRSCRQATLTCVNGE